MSGIVSLLIALLVGVLLGIQIERVSRKPW